MLDFNVRIPKSETKFTGGIKEYPTVNGGTIAICFCPETAYVFEDGDGLWSREEMKIMIKDNGNSGAFPHQESAYVEIAGNGSSKPYQDMVTKYGLTEDACMDIEKTLTYIYKYSEEREAKLS